MKSTYVGHDPLETPKSVPVDMDSGHPMRASSMELPGKPYSGEYMVPRSDVGADVNKPGATEYSGEKNEYQERGGYAGVNGYGKKYNGVGNP